MREYDSLPRELRQWLASAVLPWRAGSVKSAYKRALARCGDNETALAELDRLQMTLVARDAGRIWGTEHPAAMNTPRQGRSS